MDTQMHPTEQLRPGQQARCPPVVHEPPEHCASRVAQLANAWAGVGATIDLITGCPREHSMAQTGEHGDQADPRPDVTA